MPPLTLCVVNWNVYVASRMRSARFTTTFAVSSKPSEVTMEKCGTERTPPFVPVPV